jgi:hypothetical protein
MLTDTSHTTLLRQLRNRVNAKFYKQNPTVNVPSQEIYLQIKTGRVPISSITEGGISHVITPCVCETAAPATASSDLCKEGSLNTIANYLRNYMSEFRNSNFWAYTCDGDEEGHYIGDGGNDMYDDGNFVTPWLLSGDLYNLDSTDLDDYPYAIAYSTTSQTVVDTDFNYVSLGWIYEEDTDEPQIDQSRHPITVLGYRCSGPVGWQIGGDIGADGGGDASSNYVYNNATINGFTVYAAFRQVYNAGDPTICNLVILLGHPAWGSVFGPVSFSSDDTDTDYCQFYMYAGAGSQNILGIYTLLSKPENDSETPIPANELETVINNFTTRIAEAMNL